VEREILYHTSDHCGRGNCKYNFKQYQEAIPGQYTIDSLQKPPYWKYHTPSHKENATTGVSNSKKTRAISAIKKLWRAAPDFKQ
jgi:hypothetical protein